MNNQGYYNEPSKFQRLVRELNLQGFGYVFKKGSSYVMDGVTAKLLFLKNRPTFEYEWRTLPLFYHQYNKTWKNERAVEVAITSHLLKKYESHQVLEIGNVMNHYGDYNHKVIDLYEYGSNVVNKDAMKVKGKYNFIVSISTIEHIGFVERPFEHERARKTVKHLYNCLKPKGELLITFLYGYNQSLMEMIRDKEYKDMQVHLYKKMNGTWLEVEELNHMQGLIVLSIKKHE